MRNGVSTLALGDLHQTLGNDRTGKGSTQQILALIDSASLQCRPHVFFQEGLRKILDEYLGSTGFQCLVMALPPYLITMVLP